MNTAAGSEMSQVSGNYHEHKEPVVMDMATASIDVKIRHVFGFTFLWQAAPPVIVKLSGYGPAPWYPSNVNMTTLISHFNL